MQNLKVDLSEFLNGILLNEEIKNKLLKSFCRGLLADEKFVKGKSLEDLLNTKQKSVLNLRNIGPDKIHAFISYLKILRIKAEWDLIKEKKKRPILAEEIKGITFEIKEKKNSLFYEIKVLHPEGTIIKNEIPYIQIGSFLKGLIAGFHLQGKLVKLPTVPK